MTYLHDEVLESLLILWGLAELVYQFALGSTAQVLDALVAGPHTLETRFVSLRRHRDLLLDVQVHQLALKLLIDVLVASSNLFLLLLLINALAEHECLKCLFMCVLLHHAFKLKRVSIEGYRHCLIITY